jgi:hypothetical protein
VFPSLPCDQPAARENVGAGRPALLWTEGTDDRGGDGNPHLSPAAVYDALSYYLDHRDEIDQMLEETAPPALARRRWLLSRREGPRDLRPGTGGWMTPVLYLDEDVVPGLARLLRGHGHDVVSAYERGRQGVSDEDQLRDATAEGRALLTFNYPDTRTSCDWGANGTLRSEIMPASSSRTGSTGAMNWVSSRGW